MKRNSLLFRFEMTALNVRFGPNIKEDAGNGLAMITPVEEREGL